jgi:hypothetical protein
MIYIFQYGSDVGYNSLSFTIVRRKDIWFKYSRNTIHGFEEGNITRPDYKEYFTKSRVKFEYTCP